MGRGGFGGGGGVPGNMQALVKQAQKMQQDLAKAQADAENYSTEGSAGGGMVKVVANGKQEITALMINPQCVDPKDVAMLQDLVQAAVNDALTKVKEYTKEKLSSVTGGMSIPGMF